ncbi:hypothetical protein EAM_0542 [Erwinia amylovora ATCC 49946]|nr:hypothetical protein EAM01S_23_00030 [Erwinia amylovora NBRC 12687 = CFBP 1232]CBJ45217.1 hypothetical protein EAM_0542 [Erwinia amylovora ATCC 49946]
MQVGRAEAIWFSVYPYSQVNSLGAPRLTVRALKERRPVTVRHASDSVNCPFRQYTRSHINLIKKVAHIATALTPPSGNAQ